MSNTNSADTQKLTAEQEPDTGNSDKKRDLKVLFSLIQTMNVACRNLGAYPKEHPAIVKSFEKVEQSFQELLESHSHVTLGVAKDALMVGSKFLDRKNPVFRSFAQTLFQHGIVSLTLLKDLSLQELMDFAHIIMQKRNDVTTQGGVSALIAKTGIENIRVQLIDYSVFQTRDGLSDGEKGEEPAQFISVLGKFCARTLSRYS